MTIALTVACAAACAVLVLAEKARMPRVRIASKLVASAAFVLLGVVGLGETSFAKLVVVGLVLGAIGDAALLGRSARAFLGGLVAFLLGHVAYVVAASALVAPSRWLEAAGIAAAAPIVVGGAALVYLWPRLGSLRVPVIAYVVVIVTMVVAAIAVVRAHGLPDPQRVRFGVGAVLFFASDLAVARDRFVDRAFVNKAWGLPAYYAGQLFIAWSIIGP